MDQQQLMEWQYLEGFLGYGGTSPRLVFIGIEEHTEPNDEARVLAVRLRRRDLFGADRADKNCALDVLYPKVRATDVATWAVAAEIVRHLREHCFQEKAPENELGALGTTSSDSFLSELLPVPRQNAKGSFPVEHFGFVGEAAYHRAALGRNAGGATNRTGTAATRRWAALRDLVIGGPGQPPAFVVCYSATWRAVFDQLVGPLAVQTGVKHPSVLAIGKNRQGSVCAITQFFRGRARGRDRLAVTPDNAAEIAALLCRAQRWSPPA